MHFYLRCMCVSNSLLLGTYFAFMYYVEFKQRKRHRKAYIWRKTYLKLANTTKQERKARKAENGVGFKCLLNGI